MAGSRTLKLSILADVDDLKKKLDTGSKEVEGFGGKLENFGKVAAVAFAAAAAAAGAYAVKLAVDGVKAAIEDEAAQLRLANALKNVTSATDEQIASVEKQILQTSLATGVADDELRPALQRLAVATGDVKQSQDLLTLALDISAATGKSVEAVSNALGKAYEGNTSALGRLGVGLSSTEIKSIGLEGTIKQLSDTFGGTATVQANTFEGQIARLKIGFDEAKESVGAALLPILQQLMDYFVNTLIPKFQEAKEKAVDPIIKAFKDNEDTLRSLWAFVKNYLVPIFETVLVNSIVTVGKTIAGIVDIIATVTKEVKDLANGVIEQINKIIAAYNKIPILPNISLIPKIGSKTESSNTVSSSSLPFGIIAGVTIPPSSTSSAKKGGSLTAVPTVVTPATIPATPIGIMPTFPSGLNPSGNAIPSGFNVAGTVAANNAGVTINVNAPSAIDEEGFTRAVVLALNTSNARNGGGGAILGGLVAE
jgi:hypothetical protein